jgi:hypothetical protein
MSWDRALSILKGVYDESPLRNRTKSSALLVKAKSEGLYVDLFYGENGENCAMSMIENPETFQSMNALKFLTRYFTPYDDGCHTGRMGTDPHLHDIHTCLRTWRRNWIRVTNSRYFWYTLLGNLLDYDTNTQRCILAKRALDDMYVCLGRKLAPENIETELRSYHGPSAPASVTRTASDPIGSGSSSTLSDPDDEHRDEIHVVDGMPNDFESITWGGGYSSDEIDGSETELVAAITRRVIHVLRDAPL